MKYIRTALLATALTLTASASFANCGAGVVTALVTGGWDHENIAFKVDNSIENKTAPNDFYGFLLIEKVKVSQSRFDRMFSMLHAAYLSGKPVKIISHRNDCNNVTEVAYQ